MTTKLIVAKASNNVIGAGNDLVWRLPDDLKFFKKHTSGHHIIMGRKTFDSLGRPLPNRTSIIITRSKDYKQEGCLVAHSLKEALGMVENDETPFITGGAQIYKEALDLDLVDEMLITEVHSDYEGNTYFPEIDAEKWEETDRVYHEADEKHPVAFSFVTLRRK